MSVSREWLINGEVGLVVLVGTLDEGRDGTI